MVANLNFGILTILYKTNRLYLVMETQKTPERSKNKTWRSNVICVSTTDLFVEYVYGHYWNVVAGICLLNNMRRP